MCVFPCVPDDDPSPTTTALPLSYYKVKDKRVPNAITTLFLQE